MAAVARGRGVDVEQGLLQIFLDIPVVTRFYTVATLLITLAVNFELISQFDVYLNPTLILDRYQYWRIITAFLYVGPSNFATAFHLLFGYRYSRSLEETFFYRRSADFCFMYLFFSFLVLVLSLVCSSNLLFLGQALSHAILYLWCRRNAGTPVLIFGLITLQANQVPFFLVGLSILTGSPITPDLISLFAGHCYYFLEDVFPNKPGGFRVLKTPQFLKALFDEVPLLEETDQPQDRIDVLDENNNLLQNNVGLQ